MDRAFPPETQAKRFEPLTAERIDEALRNIPKELQALPRWVLAGRQGERTDAGHTVARDKEPIRPNGRPASVSDAATWATLDACVAAARKNGQAFIAFGFNLLRSDFVALDLDNVKSRNGILNRQAVEFLKRLGPTYTEASPSGRGVRVLFRGQLPNGLAHLRQDAFGPGTGLEGYDGQGGGRYMTLTGRALGDEPAPIAALTVEDEGVIASLLAKRQPEARTTATHPRFTFQSDHDAMDSRRGLHAVQRIADDLASVEEGGRNIALNNAALRAFRLAAGHGVPKDTVANLLRDAGERMGLPTAEVLDVVRRAQLDAEAKGPARLHERERDDGTDSEPKAKHGQAESEPEAEPKQSEQRAADDDDKPGLSWAECLALPPVEWLLPGILPLASVCVLAGHPGTGKSFVAIDWAASLSAGREGWLGHRLAHHGPVAYLALEGQAGFGGRTNAWSIAHPEAAPGSKFAFERWDWKGDAPPPLTPNGCARLRRKVAAFVKRYDRIALLVIDTFALAIGDDENDAGVVCAALAGVVAIANEFRCCVVLVHHLRKDAPNAKESAGLSSVRGSSALGGNVDQVLGLERREVRTLSVLKAKDGDGDARIEFDLKSTLTGRTLTTGEPESSCVVVSPAPEAERQSGADIARDLAEQSKRRKVMEAARRLKRPVGKDALCQEARIGAAGRGGGRALIDRMVAWGDLMSFEVGKGRWVYSVPTEPPAGGVGASPAPTHTHTH